MVDQSAIFGDNAAERLKMRKNSLQVVKLPTCDHDELATRLNEPLQRVGCWLVHVAIRRQSAIKICSKGKIPHTRNGSVSMTCGVAGTARLMERAPLCRLIFSAGASLAPLQPDQEEGDVRRAAEACLPETNEIVE